MSTANPNSEPLGPFTIALGTGRNAARLHVYVTAMADYDGISLRLSTYRHGLNVDPTDGVTINGHGPYHGSFVVTSGDTWGIATLDHPGWLHDLANWQKHPTTAQLATLNSFAGDLCADLVQRPGVLELVAAVRAWYSAIDAADAQRDHEAARAALLAAGEKLRRAEQRAAECAAAYATTLVARQAVTA